MSSSHQLTWLILSFLLVGGIVHAQDVENQEEADGDAIRPGLAQILRPKQQWRPAAQVGGGGDGDVESNEAAAQQAEADAEAPGDTAEQAAEQAEADAEAAEDASEAAQEAAEQAAEQTAEQSEAAQDAAEAAAEAAEDAEEAAADAAEAAAEAAEDAAEAAGEGSETGSEGPGLPRGFPVVGPGKGNNPDAPFFNVNGGQQGGDKGQANQVGGAQMGGDSAEETQDGAMVGEQAAGGNTESGEDGSVVGQQGTGDAESTEEAEAEDPVGPLISAPSSDVDVEEGPLSSSMSIIDEEGAPVGGSAIETDQDVSSFQKPNLDAGPLYDQAKQVSSSGTTPKAEPTPEPTEPAGEKPGEEEGLSDAYKRRLAISGASIGAIVLVGLIAFGIGRRVTRSR